MVHKNVTGRRPAGRPVVLGGNQRRGLVLDAAAQVFLSHGYAAATMSAIAVEARMSKKTLYQVFPSKLSLFDALIEDRIFQFPVTADTRGCCQEEALTRVLLGISDNMLRPEATGLIRLVMTDGQASPELATAFERLKMGSKLNALEMWLRCEMTAGSLPECDVRETSRMLFGMTVAEPVLRALCRAPPMENEKPAPQRIREAVHIFLLGLRACCKA